MTMNEYDIDEARQLLATDPVMGPAAKYLYDYKELINENSDGWPYWLAGRKCSDDLASLVDGAMKQARYGREGNYVAPTQAQVDKAIRKIDRFVSGCQSLRDRGVKAPARTPHQSNLL